VVSAKGASCPWPVSGSSSLLEPSVTDRLSSRSTADRVIGLRPTTIHRSVWEPRRSRTVRAVWIAGGGRCYSQLPASVDSYPGASLCFGRCPVGLPARSFDLASHWTADAHPPRCACCALEEREPRRSDL